jgi:diguanylate cyclase (GGDEF)-like protein/PAS domain S-box-containing protein
VRNVIEHNRMETGRDAHGIKSLNRHTLEQIVAASSAGVVIVDANRPELPIVYVNAAYERLTGYTLADLAGRPWPVLARAGDDTLAELKTAIGRGESCRATISDLCRDGTSFTSEIAVTPLTGARGDLRFFLLTHEALSSGSRDAPVPVEGESGGQVSLLQHELGRARQKLATLDRIDPATGLVRFTYFQEMLRRDLAMARRDRRFVTLLVFEIVEYEVYRQTFGDKAGDSCHRMIGAQIMRALRRAGDLCARYDERTLVAAVVGQHASEIEPLAEQISENVRQLKLHNPRAKSSRYVTTRVTVIGCPPGAHNDPEPVIASSLAATRGTDAPARAARA